jgi:hypothetical protein
VSPISAPKIDQARFEELSCQLRVAKECCESLLKALQSCSISSCERDPFASRLLPSRRHQPWAFFKL